MKQLLIVNNAQFGYHTDTYSYCRHLRGDYSITYLCWDYGFDKLELSGIRVIYVSRSGNKPARLSRFIRSCWREMHSISYEATLVVYFRFCFLLALFGKCRNIILDIRTGYVLPGFLKRAMYNAAIRVESLFFRRITVITEDLRKDLHLPLRKTHILPLGAEINEMPPRSFSAMNLLYVGTLTNRHIDKTVRGFDRFASEVVGGIELSFDIVGFGTKEDEERLRESIRNALAKDRIHFHGRVPYDKLGPYFRSCNVGVAFVPMEDHFQSQPPTKVFEYLLAGMPVIATATRANQTILDATSGVLIIDTEEGFLEGLRDLKARLATFDAERIKEDSRKFSWSSIVEHNLRPFLDTVCGRTS